MTAQYFDMSELLASRAPVFGNSDAHQLFHAELCKDVSGPASTCHLAAAAPLTSPVWGCSAGTGVCREGPIC